MTTTFAWGFNPGQHAIKNAIIPDIGKRRDSASFLAVMAPWAASDDLGLSAPTSREVHEVTVRGTRWLIGRRAARQPNAIRQFAETRLQDSGAAYEVFASMSLQRLKLTPGAELYIATALPVAWLTSETEATLAHAVRASVAANPDLLVVKQLVVKNEAAAVVYAELLDDTGALRSGREDLGRGVVCVADIGGSTCNYTVLDQIRPIENESRSPLLGSYQVIVDIASSDGTDLIDAEQRVLDHLANGCDSVIARMLDQYAQAVIGELQRAWRTRKPVAYLVAGGTSIWIAPQLMKAFGPKLRIVGNQPQQTIAIGLARLAAMQRGRAR